jgi:two-component system NarL family response regulator
MRAAEVFSMPHPTRGTEHDLSFRNEGRQQHMTKKISILVIEDNRLLRDGLAQVLDSQTEFKVVACAEGASTALQKLQEHKPNVILVDAALGRNRSQRLVESLKETVPHARLIMMDMLPEEEDVIDFIKRGANGFIAKDASMDELVNTIRQVANGGDVVPPALTGTLLSHIAKQASVLRNTPMMASVRMTKREQQITDLIAEGLSNKEIAQRLNIATYTVKSHVHNILEKLALHSRLQIAAHAHKKTPPKGDRRKFVR